MNFNYSQKSIFPTLLISAALLNSFDVRSENHSLSVGQSQTSHEYFEAYASEFKPTGTNLGYSYSISENWLMSLSYAEMSRSQLWSVLGDRGNELATGANQETDAYGIGFSWLGDDYSLSFSLSNQTNDERALARLPAVIEVISSENSAINFSYDSSLTSDEWELGYGLGIQYLDSENLTHQTYRLDPPSIAAARFEETSWSVFTDLDISYWFETESFAWAPQFTLGWNWEVSSDGTPLFLVSRDDERRFVNHFSDRVLESFKTPDAGYWEIGAFFQWESGWNLNISTGKTISSEPEITTTSVEIGVYF